ncbi:MAG: DUF2914 domain-containing protein [Methylococcales bacterium]|nr:DUF2914 domain-containing protein [Methylococcales bacterium]
MVESNRFVIKINHPEADDRLKIKKRPEMVTVWHVKRIVIAVLLLLALILFPFYFFSGEAVEDELEIKDTQVEPQKIVEAIIKENRAVRDIKSVDVNVITNQESDVLEKEPAIDKLVDKRIARALLTTKLNNKEPVDKITPPVIVNKSQATGIYYFTEIINMKGHALYHQWLWNDNIIFKRKINILGDRWRAATGKLITYAKQGVWRVRLVDKQGVILNEIVFKVELK